MLNPKLSARYAKSLMDIALEQSKLDALYKDMLGLQSICRNSREFVNLMKSPIVKSDTKMAVVKSLIEGKTDPMTLAFVQLIVTKGRDYFLPEIIDAFISQYKKHKNINEVKLTTAVALDDAMLEHVKAKVAAQFPGMSIDMTTAVDENLLGGFILESNNNQFDASILRDLRDIKKQFLKNEFVQNIR